MLSKTVLNYFMKHINQLLMEKTVQKQFSCSPKSEIWSTQWESVSLQMVKVGSLQTIITHKVLKQWSFTKLSLTRSKRYFLQKTKTPQKKTGCPEYD